MPGPAQPRDLPEDPRDETVDLPRIDLASYGLAPPDAARLTGTGDPRPTPPARNGRGPRSAASSLGRADAPGHAPAPGRTGPPDRTPRPGHNVAAGPMDLPSRVPPSPGWTSPDMSRNPYARPGEETSPASFGAAAPRPAQPVPIRPERPDGAGPPQAANLAAEFGADVPAVRPLAPRPPAEPRAGFSAASLAPSAPPLAAEPAGPIERTTPTRPTRPTEPTTLTGPIELPERTTPTRPTRLTGPIELPERTTPTRPTRPTEPTTLTGPIELPESAGPTRAAELIVPDDSLAPAPAAGAGVGLPAANGTVVSSPPVADPALSPAAPGRPADRQRDQARGRASAGSLADLRSRLDRLPDGHPSSPYDDGGIARPLPQRLRQLELGLPAPEREAGDKVRVPDQPAHPDSGDRAEDETGQAPAGPVHEPAAPHAPRELPRSQRRTDDPPGRSGPAGNGARPVVRADAPDISRDPYALPPAGNGRSRPSPHLDYRRAPGPDGDDEDVTGTLGPLTRPHDIQPRWRAGHNGADGARNSAPSRDERQAAAPRPSEDQHQLVAEVVAACRAAEGQNVFGGYGQSGLTPTIMHIAAQLGRGRLAPGSEADTLKSADRMSAKLARLIDRHPGRTAEELAAGIADGVRYAFAFDPDFYTEGTWLVHRKLKAQGFELEARRNRWDSPEYKGVWSRWRDPAHDLSFEVQFHTSASWEVVRRTHHAYVRITDPQTPAGERARLRTRQVSAAASAKAPPGWAEITDFGREAR
jgi:hypothetical protein